MSKSRSKKASPYRLKHFVHLERGETDFLLFGSEAFEVDSELASDFKKFKRRAQGNDLSLPAFADPKTEQAYQRFLIEAKQLDLVFQPDVSKNSVPYKEFEQAIESALVMWKPLTSLHVIFQKIKVSPALFAFYLLELTYFVSKAESYLAPAVESARTKKLSILFKKLLEEERQHYLDLLKGIGLDVDQLLAHDPTAGTHALYTHLFQLSVTDPESLLVSLSLFETDAHDIGSVERFFGQHTDSVDFVPQPFIEHHKEDIAMGHVSLWRDFFGSTRGIDASRASKFIEDLHRTKHVIELWRDSVLAEGDSLRSLRGKDKILIGDLIRPKPIWGSV